MYKNLDVNNTAFEAYNKSSSFAYLRDLSYTHPMHSFLRSYGIFSIHNSSLQERILGTDQDPKMVSISSNLTCDEKERKKKD